jgi:hypothetical protein
MKLAEQESLSCALHLARMGLTVQFQGSLSSEGTAYSIIDGTSTITRNIIELREASTLLVVRMILAPVRIAQESGRVAG